MLSPKNLTQANIQYYFKFPNLDLLWHDFPFLLHRYIDKYHFYNNINLYKQQTNFLLDHINKSNFL